MKQVDHTHYEFLRYSNPARFASYYYQLKELFDAKPQSILEIGVGDAVIGSYVRTNSQITYTSFDYAEDLHPDIVGDVCDIKLARASHDVVCAFEVLEHIPFEKFETAIGQMVRVARKRVVISVPHFGPPILFLLKIPFVPLIRYAFKIPFPRKHTFNGQHYWELGKKGYSPARVREVLKKYGTIVRDYVPFENQYHHFFVLDVANPDTK